MSIEATLICDLCAQIIDAAATAFDARLSAKRDGAYERIRVDDKVYDVCRSCHRQYGAVGGTNSVRRFIRSMTAEK